MNIMEHAETRFISLDMYVHVLQAYKQCESYTMKEERCKIGHLGGQLFKQRKERTLILPSYLVCK